MQPGPIGLRDGCSRQRCPLEFGEEHRRRTPELRLQHGTDAFWRFRRGTALQLAELGAYLRWDEVDSGRGDLPDLHVDAAGVFEYATDAHPYRLCRPFLLAPCAEEGTEPLPTYQSEQFAVATHHVQARLHGAQRTRGRDQACLFRNGERTGPGQQVESYRNAHRGRHGYSHHVGK